MTVQPRPTLMQQMRAVARRVPLARRVKRLLDRTIFGIPYAAWIAKHHTLDDAQRREIAAQIANLPSPPLISVLMPVWNSDPKWLEVAIDSIRRQLYPHWELCLSDDASDRADVKALLRRVAGEDSRIKVHFRATRGHISANTNSALALATGVFVALVDADDEVSEDALFRVAQEIVVHPDVDMIFSDEDKIDEKGRRFSPYFKSDWNPALMLGQNAFSHLGAFRRTLVEQAGGLREGYEGAQDHDLTLRCAEATTPDRIRHIPRVLYHWRTLPQSTANGIDAKPYAVRAGLRAVRTHLERSGIVAEVAPGLNGFYRVTYARPVAWPKVTIVIPSTLGTDTARQCLDVLMETSTYPNFEVLITLHSSHVPRQADGFLKNPRVRVVSHESQPFNYSFVNNRAVMQADGDYICLLNDDVEVMTPDWLEQMMLRCRLDNVGAVGAKLYYPNGRIQHAGVLLGIGGVADHAHRHLRREDPGYFARAVLDQDLSGVTAACMVMPRAVFDEVGQFDEDLPCAFNDVDLCLRIRRAGYRILWTSAAEMVHHESLTMGQHDSVERRNQFLRDIEVMRHRWGSELDADPHYNPNLSLDGSAQFELACPPRTGAAKVA